MEFLIRLFGANLVPAGDFPLSVTDIPPVDVVVTMGCNVECPFLPCKYREDWGLDDPTGKDKDEFIKTAQLIEEKVRDLKAE